MTKFPISYSKKNQEKGYIALDMDNKPAAFAPTLDAIKEYTITENRRHYMYKEFPEIAIPAFLQGPEWEDTSWGNDATASSTLILPKECGYELRVLVYAEAPANREYLDDPRYCVCVYELQEGGSDMLESDNCNTEAEAVAWINTYKGSIELLETNRKNRG